MQKSLEKLYLVRKESQKELTLVINFVNQFKNTPESMNLKLEKIEIKLDRYQNLIDVAQAEYHKANVQSSGTAVAGIATGVGVAALAPTAALAVATTFGTAATGTAIASLSGAAASNAALAWLGGGALVAGGGGVAGGEALLALAGPIGWGIGAAALVGGGLISNGKNKKAANKMLAQAIEVRSVSDTQRAMNTEINNMIKLTYDDINDFKVRLAQMENYEKDFKLLDEQQIYLLGTLVNNMHSGVERLNAVMGKNGHFTTDNAYNETEGNE